MRNTKNAVKIAFLICAGFAPTCLSTLTVPGPRDPIESTESESKSQNKRPLNTSESPGITDAVKEDCVIHFPKTRSLGRLMIEVEKSNVRITPFGFPFEAISSKYFGQAQGDVTIPRGKRVRLILYSWTWQNPENLSALKQLKPDDIYSLILSPKWSPGGRRPSDKCMPYVVHLTGLNALNVDGAHMTSRGLEHLTKIESLERLKLPAGLADSGMVHVGKLKSLKVLYFGANNYVTNDGLRKLSNLKSLELLVLRAVRMNDEGLKHLSSLPSLNHLILGGSFTNDAALYLKDVPSLRTLYIGVMEQDSRSAGLRPSLMQRFNDRGMKHVSGLTQLENFSAHWMERITDSGVAYLKNMPSLKCLDVGHARFTDKAMLDLKQIQTLEYLRLPNHGLTDAALRHVAELKNLRDFWIGCSSKSPLTDEALRYISELKNLEVLSIGGSHFTDDGMKHIAMLTNLKRLSLSKAGQLTNKGLSELSGLESLTSLHLRGGPKVSISGLKSLNDLKKLRNLSITDIHQDNSIMDISGLTSLERLTLLLHRERKAGSFISESFRNEDWACLANLAGLRNLTISGMGIDDGGIKHISGLKKLEFLTIVCRGEARITDAGLRYFTNMKGLYQVKITDGHFTDRALAYLEDMPSLSRLELTSDYAFSRSAIRNFKLKNPDFEKLRLMP